MRLEGIEGEEPIGDSQKLIKLQSYSHSLAMPSVPARPSVGKDVALRRSYCEHGLFRVVKAFDNTSPKLFEACANGVVFPSVLIYLCIHRANPLSKDQELEPMLTIVLSDAIMASFDYAFDADWPMEHVGFRYSSIGWKTDWIDPEKGSDKKLEPVGWEGTENTPADISIPGDLKWGSGSLL